VRCRSQHLKEVLTGDLPVPIFSSTAQIRYCVRLAFWWQARKHEKCRITFNHPGCVQAERSDHSRTQQELNTTCEACATLQSTNAVLRSELEAAHVSAAAAATAAAEDSAVMRHEFESRLNTANAELDEQQTRYDDLRARYEDAELHNQGLEASMAKLKTQLEGERERLASALTHASATRQQERAAAVIQRNWRHWQQRQLVDARAQDARGWQEELRALSYEQRLAAAQAGRALVLSCVQQLEATTHTLLMEMLLSGAVKRKVKAAQKAAGISGSTPQAASWGDNTSLSANTNTPALASSGAATPLGSAQAEGGFMTPPRSAIALFTPRKRG
jgi:hypothetical protein